MHTARDHTKISRRSFATMAMAGAGLSLLPLRADAKADIEALCITCIDFRAIDSVVRFLQDPPNAPGVPPGLGLRRDYDMVALAGASLASVSLAFPSSIGAVWEHIALARTLHAIKRVIVIDHRDCGAYKAVFGGNPTGCEEYEQHRGVMLKMRTEFERRGWKAQGLGLSFYLMDKPGTEEEEAPPWPRALPYYRSVPVNVDAPCQ